MDELSEYRQRIGLFNISVVSKSKRTVKRRKTENVRKPCKSALKRGSVNRRRKQPRRQNVQSRKMEYCSKSENFSPTLSESKSEHSQSRHLFLSLLIIVSALLILDKNIVKLDVTDSSKMPTKIFRDAILTKTEPVKAHLIANVKRHCFQTKSGFSWHYTESAFFDLKQSGFASMQEASENLKTILNTSYHCMNINNSTTEYSCFQIKSMEYTPQGIGDMSRTCEQRHHLETCNVLIFGFDSTPRFKTKHLEYKDVYHHHITNSVGCVRTAPGRIFKQERGCLCCENDLITVQRSPRSSGVFSTHDSGCGFPIAPINTELRTEKVKVNHGLLLNHHAFRFSVKESYECDTCLPSFCRQSVFKCFWCMDTVWTYFIHQIHHYVQFFCKFRPENIELWLFIKPLLDILFCCGILMKTTQRKTNSPTLKFQGNKSRTCNASLPVNFLGFRKHGICCACDCSCLGSCYYLLGNAGCHMYNGNPEDGTKIEYLHRQMAFLLSKKITPSSSETWSAFISMMSVYLDSEEKDSCKDVFNVFDKLSEKGVISIGNYDFLCDVFTTIEQFECHDIVKKHSTLIETERSKQNEQPQPGGSGLQNKHGTEAGERRRKSLPDNKDNMEVIYIREQKRRRLDNNDTIEEVYSKGREKRKKQQFNPQERRRKSLPDNKDNMEVIYIREQKRRRLDNNDTIEEVYSKGREKRKKQQFNPQEQTITLNMKNSTLTMRDLGCSTVNYETGGPRSEESRAELTDQMECQLELWNNNEKHFVETKATKAVSEAIRKFNVVIIIGCAGSGKSYSMQHAALQLQANNFAVYPIKKSSDLLSYHNKNKRQAFVIDDTLGINETDLEILKDWQKKKNEVHSCIASKRTKLILTIRKEIFNEVGTVFLHRDLEKKEVDINSKDLKLTEIEKIGYLYELSKKRNIETPDYFLLNSIATCEFDFFPLLCHTYCTDIEIRADPLHLFQEPYAMLEKWFEEMWKRNPPRFYGLVLCVVYEGSLPTRLFDQFRLDLEMEQNKLKKIVSDLDNHVELETIRKELDSLHGVYVYKTNHTYKFVHQTFQDIIVFVIGKQKNGFILKYCKSHFILDRCIISRQVTKIRQEVKYGLILPTKNYNHKAEKRSNSYKIDVDESIENGIAAKILQELFEEENFEKFKILAEKAFDSNFLQEESFLNIFSCILNNQTTDNEKRKNYLLYELHLNACMIHSKMIDLPFLLSYRGFHLHLTFSKRNVLLFVCILSENVEVMKALIEQNGADVHDYKFRHLHIFNPLTPLCHACGKGNISIVQSLVNSRANVNKCDGDGNTPLTYSVMNNHMHIANLLLNENADVNLCDKDNLASTPLCSACVNGNMDMVRKLLQNGADINRFNGKGNTPLTVSIMENNIDVVDILLIKNADVNLSGKSELASTPLCSACKKGNVVLVQKLLQKGADISKFDGKGNTPLTISVMENNMDIVDVLLSKKNADVNLCGENKLVSTPLCATCKTNNVDIIRKLLQKGADINKYNGEGNTPLTISVMENNMDIVDVLLFKNADVNLSGKSELASTPLCSACKKGNVVLVQKLLQKGADINKFDGEGNTPLTISVMENNMDIVDVLLLKNADVNLCGESESASTPLDDAYQKNNVDIVRKLVQKSADTQTLFGEGNTPLTLLSVMGNTMDIVDMLPIKNADVYLSGESKLPSTPLCTACKQGNIDMVRKLLQKGADVNIVDGKGNSPLTISVMENSMDIIDILLAKNADVNLSGESKSASTPLCTSCGEGKVDLVRKLLEKGADLNKYNGEGDTPLTIAVMENNMDIVDILLSNYADVNLCSKSESASTPLCNACRNGNVDMVRRLIQIGADINKFELIGNTPLAISVMVNNMDIVEILLSRYADINLCGEESGLTPLCFACLNGNLVMVQKLLQQGADINKFSGKGNTPLTISMLANNMDIVEILLSRYADMNLCGESESASTPLCAACMNDNEDTVRKLLQKEADINKCNGKGNTPLTISVMENNMDIVDILLGNNADVNLCGERESTLTPLCAACCKGNVNMVRKLLQNGADINKFNGEGDTPLTISVMENNMDIVDVLLGNNADVNLCGESESASTPLCAACMNDNKDTVRKLLQKEADINKCNGKGNTSLTISVMENNMDIVDILLGNNANVNLCGERESTLTPLCAACCKGNVDMVRKLLQNGADINKFDGKGNTPLTVSVITNNMDVVEILLSRNADMSLCDKRKSASTPLCAACCGGNVNMVQKLLQNGADINKFDGKGNTPLTISVMENNMDVVEILLSRNADMSLCDERKSALTPLCVACCEGNLNMVRHLLQKGADINKLSGDGNTPLVASLWKNKMDVVDLLLSKNADVNLCGEKELSITPLFAACCKGTIDMVRKLLEKGADINKGEVSTPLTVSLMVNNMDIVDLLLSKNADVNLCGEREFAITPLFAASGKGNIDMVRKLLQKGADINKFNGKGNTPLTISVTENNMDIVDVLLSKNADVNLCGDKESAKTPLCFACCTGNLDMVRKLIQKGADVNKFCVNCVTPLTISVMENNMDIVDVLLSKNADVNLCDEKLAITPLCAACVKSENVDMVRKLLQKGADINKFDGNGNTPLTESVRVNNVDIIDVLLSKNADVNLCGERDSASTPLCTACFEDNVDMVRKLLQKGADVNKCNGHGLTPLMISIIRNNMDIVEILSKNTDVNWYGELGLALTPLSFACCQGNVDMVQKLLQKGADINIFDGFGNTPLTLSVSRNSMNIVKILLNRNADVNLCGERELAKTPLYTACCHGNVIMVRKLLQKGADINKFDGKGNTPLTVSVMYNKIDIVEILLSRNADVNLCGERESAITPLYTACCQGNVNMVRKLLQKGADINKFDGNGNTPLTVSVMYNKIDIVEILLSRNADVNLCGERESAITPLYTACCQGNVNMVRKLLQKGADINKFDGNGNTPLTVSVMYNKIDIVEILLSRNADVNLCGKSELALTPLGAACKNDNVDMVRKLLQKGADINRFDGNGKTQLTVSLFKNNMDIAENLLNRNADVNLCGERESAITPLCAACCKGNVNMVRKLLQKGADINKFDGKGNTPLTVSVMYNNMDVVDILLSRNADVNLCGESESALTPICAAYYEGNVDMVHKLQQNADINQSD